MDDLKASPAFVPGTLQSVGDPLVGSVLGLAVEIQHVVDGMDAAEKPTQGLPSDVGTQALDLLAEALDVKTHRGFDPEPGTPGLRPLLEDGLGAIFVRQGLDPLHGAFEEILIFRHRLAT